MSGLAADRDRELLVAKLTVPSSRAGTVSRAALVARLSESELSTVIIIAPAGYGKTTLLGEWAARDSRPFAWVAVDRRDNDLVLLLTHVAAALGESESVDESVLEAVSSPGISIWSKAMPRLGSTIASRSVPFVLVLDDVHELSNEDTCDVVAALGQHIPAGSQLVLAGRVDPRPEASRMRVAGLQLALGTDDLAFTLNETQALFEQAGTELAPGEAQELHERAEGWAAGLYLAALALRGSDGGPRVLPSEFAGDDRLVAEYLRVEHLSHLPKQKLLFLTRTAVLERMCASLCDAVLERKDSSRLLEGIERSNLFLVPLDRSGVWYRYHHLFRDALLAELERREGDVVPVLSTRAADWCEEHGLVEDAIAYAEQGGDIDRMARLVVAHAIPYYREGRVATVETWLDVFDEPASIASYPMVGVLGIWAHTLRGRPADAERWISAVELTTYDGPVADGSLSIQPWIDVVNALLCRNGIERMGADAARASPALGLHSPWRPLASLLQGIAALLSGEEEQADQRFAQAVELSVGLGATYATVVALAERGLIAMGRGEHTRAADHVAHGFSLVDEERLWDYTPTAILSAVGAQVALRVGNRTRARTHLANAQRLRPQLTYALPHLAVQTRLELASAHLALGDIPGAAALLEEMVGIVRRRPDLGLLGGRVRALREQLASHTTSSDGWASSLTAAELRLLPLLTTHLSFREIGERLFVSRNTVKTQAISAYRKLGASSRSEAVVRAAELGLIDLSAVERADFTP